MFKNHQDKITNIIESKTSMVFDFDGVLVDSVNIKTEAFAQLYKDFDQQVVEKVISHNISDFGGISREKKIKYYHNNFLKTDISKIEIEELCDRFSKLVLEAIVDCKEIKGANRFLERYCVNNKLSFVNSATPLAELKEIIARRGMGRFFDNIYGSPNSKLDNLKFIFSRYNLTPDATVIFGDKMADFEAAEAAGCDFIAIGNSIDKDVVISQSTKKYGFLVNFDTIL